MPIAERIQCVEHYAIPRPPQRRRVLDIHEPEIPRAVRATAHVLERYARGAAVVAPLEAQQEQTRPVGLAAVPLDAPVRAFQRKRELQRAARVCGNGNVAVQGPHGFGPDAVFALERAVEYRPLDAVRAVRVGAHVLLPRRRALLRWEKEERVVRGRAVLQREMLQGELCVGRGEETGFKHLLIRLVILDVTCSPTSVHQLPLPAVHAHGVPRVIRRGFRDSAICCQRGVPEPFTMATELARLEPRVSRQKLKQAGITVAHGSAFYDGLLTSRPAHAPREKRRCVVRDVVVQPRKDGARFIRRRREGPGQLEGQPAQIHARW